MWFLIGFIAGAVATVLALICAGNFLDSPPPSTELTERQGTYDKIYSRIDPL